MLRQPPAASRAFVLTVASIVAVLHSVAVGTPYQDVAIQIASPTIQSCFPMFAQQDIPGGEEPHIQITFPALTRGKVSWLVAEYRDLSAYVTGIENTTGTSLPPNYPLCTDEAVVARHCRPDQLDLFFTKPAPPGQSTYARIAVEVFDFAANHSTSATIPPLPPYTIRYVPQRTGFYCLYYALLNMDVGAELDLETGGGIKVEEVNPFGLIPAYEYPYLPFYGILSLTYLALGTAWMVKSALHWRDILMIQNYIAAVIFVLMLDNAFYYGFYENWNVNGVPSNVLLGVVSFFNAVRITASMFVLLIVALGYGVVKPTLGTLMRKCVALGVALFFCSLLYNTGSRVADRRSGFQMLLIVVPNALVMTIFLSWTLTALRTTTELLKAKRQTFKIRMYERLYLVLAVGCLVAFLFMLIDIFTFPQQATLDWWARNWHVAWFLRDGWMNITYLVCFVCILLLWRPTSNNARYGLEELQNFDVSDLEMVTTANGGTVAGQNVMFRSSGRSPDREHDGEDPAKDVLFERSDVETEDGGGDGDEQDIVGWTEKNVYAMGTDSEGSEEEGVDLEQGGYRTVRGSRGNDPSPNNRGRQPPKDLQVQSAVAKLV